VRYDIKCLAKIYVDNDMLSYNRPENLSNSVKKMQNKGYYGVQGHRSRYRSKARMQFSISD